MKKKKVYCKKCNRRMREADALVDTRSPIYDLYGTFRFMTDTFTIDRVKHRFYKCKKCDIIFQL